MNTANNPSQSKVFARRIRKRFHSAVNALRANPLARDQKVNLEGLASTGSFNLEVLASTGDPSYKENIFIPKGGNSTAAVSKRQVLGDVRNGVSRIFGSEMPQEMRDETVRASHRRQPVLKTLVECSDRSDGIGSDSGDEGGRPGGDEGPTPIPHSIDTVEVGSLD
jgi:hypothetical protein